MEGREEGKRKEGTNSEKQIQKTKYKKWEKIKRVQKKRKKINGVRQDRSQMKERRNQGKSTEEMSRKK